MPFKSELILEKKSLLAPEITLEVATSEVLLLVDSRLESFGLVKESFRSRPFLVTASFALFVRSPKVLFPTYVKSSIVFLLTAVAVLLASKALLPASCTLLDASSAAFFAWLVS